MPGYGSTSWPPGFLLPSSPSRWWLRASVSGLALPWHSAPSKCHPVNGVVCYCLLRSCLFRDQPPNLHTYHTHSARSQVREPPKVSRGRSLGAWTGICKPPQSGSSPLELCPQVLRAFGTCRSSWDTRGARLQTQPSYFGFVMAPVVSPTNLEVGMARTSTRAMAGVGIRVERSPGYWHHQVGTWRVIYTNEIIEKGVLELEGPMEVKCSFILQGRNRSL